MGMMSALRRPCVGVVQMIEIRRFDDTMNGVD